MDQRHGVLLSALLRFGLLFLAGCGRNNDVLDPRFDEVFHTFIVEASDGDLLQRI